jgi:predicted aspartyl protease
VRLVVEGPVDNAQAIIEGVRLVGRHAATVNALIDTGCITTAISESLVSRLGIVPHGAERVQTADGIVDADAYYVKVGLPGARRPPFTIRAIELREMGLDMLLGMNIIRLGRLLITETRFVFTLEEPVN